MWQLVKADVAYGVRWLVACLALALTLPAFLALLAGSGRFERLGISTGTVSSLAVPAYCLGVIWATWVYLDIRRKEEGKENRFRFLGPMPVSLHDIGASRLLSMVLLPYLPATLATLLYCLASAFLDLQLDDPAALRLWLASLHGFGLILIVLMFIVPDNVRNVFTVGVAAGVPALAIFVGQNVTETIVALFPTLPMAAALNLIGLALAAANVATFGLRRQLLTT
jgi:hypothetical protein